MKYKFKVHEDGQEEVEKMTGAFKTTEETEDLNEDSINALKKDEKEP